MSLMLRINEYDAAIALYLDCFENQIKEVLESDHPNTLMSVHNLATMFFNPGNYHATA